MLFFSSAIKLNTDYTLDYLLLHHNFVYFAFALVLKLDIAEFRIFNKC